MLNSQHASVTFLSSVAYRGLLALNSTFLQAPLKGCGVHSVCRPQSADRIYHSGDTRSSISECLWHQAELAGGHITRAVSLRSVNR